MLCFTWLATTNTQGIYYKYKNININYFFPLLPLQNNSQEIFKLGPRVWNIKDWLLNSFLNKAEK